MNQLNEKSHERQKGTTWLGYTEESESSKKGAQKNQRPTCNHFGQVKHTSNKWWSNGQGKFNGNIAIAINMVIGLMNAKRNENLKENFTSVRNTDTSYQNVKPTCWI